MKTVKIPSPARSQGAGPRTPIRKRRNVSVSSARSNASGKLTALIQRNRNMDSFVVSPLPIRRSILSDNTEIEEPRRKSWWKNLGENSRDVIELLEENKVVEPNNIIEDLDIEVLSQEKRNYTMDLPESSDSESISSIVIPQRKLFTQKENQQQKHFGEIIGTRETLDKLHKPNTANVDKALNVPTRELFQNKQRSKPIFPAALLNISPNKTMADKTKDFATVEPKPQVRNIFGNRGTKRKNIFTNFIVSESEDEIPEIQPKVFGFKMKTEARRRGSSSSRGLREPSPTSSITTDIEMDDWKMLPSSTMVEYQLENMMADGNSPKRSRLSKLIEIESDAGSNATKQSSKTASPKLAEKSRKSKTFTKEKAADTSMTKNKSKTSLDEEEIFEQNEEVPNKSRKSKTFTKDKAPDESMTTKNKSKASQNDYDQEIFVQNQDVLNKSAKDADKSRKSKTFTKDKAHDSINTRNKSKVSQDDIEEISGQNKSSKDTEKSRKSKTFTKEKASLLEASMSKKNMSKVTQEDEEIFVQNQIAHKSKSKLADLNVLHASIKTGSLSKNNSLNSSQIMNEENENAERNKTQSNKNKPNIATSPKDNNIVSEGRPGLENDDDELNFTLQYENEDHQNEEMPETNQSQSNTKTRASKSMTQQENSVNVSKSNKTMPNYKVIEESAELESTQEKSNNTSKIKNKVEINYEQTDQPIVASSNSDSKNEVDEMEVQENELQQDSVENQGNDESHKNISQHVDDNEEREVENNDKNEIQNESLVEKCFEQTEENNESQEIENASENEKEQSHEVLDQSQLENVSQELRDESDDNDENLEVEDENEERQIESDVEQNESEVEQNESEVEQNESEVEQNESEDEENNSEVEQNESEVEQNESEVERNDSEGEQNESEDEENNSEVEQNKSEVEQNVSQEVENENEEQNISQEAENEDEEQNISREVENEDEEQNISQEAQQSTDEQNDSEESEAIADSDNENNQPDNSQDVDNNSENDQDDEIIESAHDENQEEIETPNVSHDTTGRNRKKNESPEVILHDSNDHLESFAVQGRNTSIRKTEMIKSMNIRPSLAPVRESTGFSDGTRNSSAEGSGWDSHRTTRKTLRQTLGRDFSPRKSLRALVMEKSAKRQTQHNEIASVTAKFPQANSTELPEMSNRYDDDVDENQEPNHEVSLRTRQTMLEEYLQKIKKKNTEDRLKMEEAVLNSLNAPPKEHIFKVPAKPLFARRQTKSTAKPKKTKSTLFLGELPSEVIEDLKYKPPKRFQPGNAPWITKRLYKFLESKLESKYDYKARVRAEKLVENIYHFAKDLRRHDVATTDAVDVLKREMARLDIVKTHFEFYEFFHQFMPREVRVKVVPDVVNKMSLPRHGVFSAIL